MRIHSMLAAVAVCVTTALASPGAALAQDAQIPVDSWPRIVSAGGDKLTIYEPQVESWVGNVLRARAAIAVETPALPKDAFDKWAAVFARRFDELRGIKPKA